MSEDQRRVLIVEDDEDLAQAIARAVRSLDPKPALATTVARALGLLTPTPDLIICDVRLPDGTGVQVAEAAVKLRPIPPIIAISGSATPEEAFILAQRGVRGYLRKPLSLPDLRNTIDRLMAMPPDLGPLIAPLVGQRPMQDVQTEVRKTMVEQALGLTGGNRSDASRLLNVSRQAVQQMARDLEVAVGSRDDHEDD